MSRTRWRETGYKLLANKEKDADILGKNYHSIDMRAAAPINKGARPYISGRTALYMRAPAQLHFFNIENAKSTKANLKL